ncbi:hypothetical protein GFM02_09645 [Rhizobium leguminosarum bv. viciae]|nr:hypothetical protein [Rhizobium leguminosarum bv. viciae]NKM29561.1 hypothetical protein [Rhizobium laguerreae]NKM63039.1 hypothetical protein [Rhizobium leguminosarum bv. viciae]TBY09676.1 hypothetical protein E0J21_11140 [Rhizobium laguerreae]
MSFEDARPQLQADAVDADNTIKTEAATKTAARYEFIEIPIRAAQILRASMHSMNADLSGLRRRLNIIDSRIFRTYLSL